MSVLTQLGLLLWKNFTYRRRQTLQLLIEVIWPLLVFFILIAVRINYPPYEQNECHFPNKAMPSAGILPWMQGIICNANNPCFRHPTPGESPGVVGNFNDSIISRLFSDSKKILLYSQNDKNLDSFKELAKALQILQATTPGFKVKDFLKDNDTLSPFLVQKLSLGEDATQGILDAHVNLERVLLKGYGVHLRSLCRRSGGEHDLEDFVVIADARLAARIQEMICRTPGAWLDVIEERFVGSLDLLKLLRRDVKSDPVAVRQVVAATNGLLESMGSLAVELASMKSWKDLRSEILFLTHNATSSPSAMYQAVSRIVCGHPEGGGLQIKSLNWYEDSNYKALFGNHNTTEEDLAAAYDNTSTPFCNNLMRSMDSNPMSRMMWQAIKPLLMGKILYTPHTPATQKIIHEVNRTFQELGVFRDLGGMWEEMRPKVWTFLENGKEINFLRTLLRNNVTAGIFQDHLSHTEWTAADVSAFLVRKADDRRPPGGGGALTWRDVFNETDDAIKSISRFMECVNLDKLEAVDTEEKMIDKSMVLLEDRKFWAGIVFPDIDTNSSELPPKVNYKIRMDIDNVERTNKIKDAYGTRSRATPEDMRTCGAGLYLQGRPSSRALCGRSRAPRRRRAWTSSRCVPCYVDDILRPARISRSMPSHDARGCTRWPHHARAVVYERGAASRRHMRIMGLDNGVLWMSCSSAASSLLSQRRSAGVLLKSASMNYSTVGSMLGCEYFDTSVGFDREQGVGSSGPTCYMGPAPGAGRLSASHDPGEYGIQTLVSSSHTSPMVRRGDGTPPRRSPAAEATPVVNSLSGDINQNLVAESQTPTGLASLRNLVAGSTDHGKTLAVDALAGSYEGRSTPLGHKRRREDHHHVSDGGRGYGVSPTKDKRT
ncbi:unnamed protein product [Boreogadus saida]